MKSWAFYCIKHKDFGNWKIKTDVYVAGLWFLVQLMGRSVTFTYIHWDVLECIMFSVMVASYERDEPWVLKQFMSKYTMQMARDIFIFS